MRLVPLACAEIVLGGAWSDDPRYYPLVQGARSLGGRVELDVAAAGVLPAVADALVGYADADRSYAERFSAGRPVGPWIITKRRVGSWQQGAGTKSARRGDLHEQLIGLEAHPETQVLVEHLLTSQVDVGALERAGVLLRSDEKVTRAELTVEGHRSWGAALGGAASASEIERLFVVEANHAAWRDRVLRRLCSLEVWSIELHTDPAPWRELIDGGAGSGHETAD